MDRAERKTAVDLPLFGPRSVEACEECVKNDYKWVHPRLFGNCSPVVAATPRSYVHTTKHFYATDHPVIASPEPNENWPWCYEDDCLVPLVTPSEFP